MCNQVQEGYRLFFCIELMRTADWKLPLLKRHSVEQNFVEFFQTARILVFLCILVLTTQQGVLFVSFDEFVEVAGYFHIVTLRNNQIAITTTTHRMHSHFPCLKLASIDGVTAA